jgi:hypothetical protein
MLIKYGIEPLSHWSNSDMQQMSTFSCATLALMNIINNQPDLNLGEQLTAFKQKTALLSPKDRGFALDDFQFVKDIHNSFSRHAKYFHITYDPN